MTEAWGLTLAAALILLNGFFVTAEFALVRLRVRTSRYKLSTVGSQRYGEESGWRFGFCERVCHWCVFIGEGDDL